MSSLRLRPRCAMCGEGHWSTLSTAQPRATCLATQGRSHHHAGDSRLEGEDEEARAPGREVTILPSQSSMERRQ